MRRVPTTLALLAAIALVGGCDCDTDDPAELCEAHEDCTEEGKEYCDTDSGACVECTDDGHCGEDEVCSDFECAPDTGNGGNGGEGCTTDADCTEAGAEYCHVGSGECVECMSSDHCDQAAGEECISNTCRVPRDCDVTGFDAVDDFSGFRVSRDGPVLYYGAIDREEYPLDMLEVAWWFNDGADWKGEGVYELDPTANPIGCGVCVTIYEGFVGDDADAVFFAVEGAIEVTEVRGDGDPFNGVLRNVALVEWDFDANAPLENGRSWCLDGYAWQTILDGDLPPPPCESDTDCSEPRPYCDTATGVCKVCVDDTHCPDGEECLFGACRVGGECENNGFEPDTQQTTFSSGSNYLQYVGNEGTDDGRVELQIEWYASYGAPFEGIGTYEIEKDTNYADCGLCVRIRVYDNDENRVGYYFAVDGEIEVTHIDRDTDSFRGTLHDVVFLEWDANADAAVPSGELWCIDGFGWDAPVPPSLPCNEHADCATGAFCDNNLCVECLEDGHCGLAQGCVDGVCEVRCDEQGFDATAASGEYDEATKVLHYDAVAGDMLLTISWTEDVYIGAGVYPIQASNPDDCELCVQVAKVDPQGEVEKLYVAMSGTVMITEILGEDEPFKGVLRDALFVEWDTATNAYADNAATWCINEHEWDVVLSGDIPEFLCQSHDHCTLPGREYCADTGACVTCTETEHCNQWSDCVDFVCEVSCDETGFEATVHSTDWLDWFGLDLLTYSASTSEEGERTELSIEFWGGFGAMFEGVGEYPVEQNGGYFDCSLCVSIRDYDANDDLTAFFFAIDGVVEITATNYQLRTFEGLVHDAVFVEWDYDNDKPVEGGIAWCVDGFVIEGELPEDFPIPPCTDDEDCSEGSYCVSGACVECRDDEHCEGEEACMYGSCRVPGFCEHEGFEIATEGIGFFPDYNAAFYEAESTTDDVMFIEFMFGEDALSGLGVGAYELGQGANDNYRTCTLCLIAAREERLYYAVSGTLNITAVGGDGTPFAATLDDVVMIEVDVAPDYTSTPVAGGAHWCLDEHAISGTMEGTPPLD